VLDGQIGETVKEIDLRICMIVTDNGIPVQTSGREPNLMIASGKCNLKSGIKDEDQAPGRNPVVQAMQKALSG